MLKLTTVLQARQRQNTTLAVSSNTSTTFNNISHLQVPILIVKDFSKTINAIQTVDTIFHVLADNKVQIFQEQLIGKVDRLDLATLSPTWQANTTADTYSQISAITARSTHDNINFLQTVDIVFPMFAGNNKTQIPQEQIIIKADHLNNNHQTNTITAIGNVEIEQNDSIIFTNQITYRQQEKLFVTQQPIQFMNTVQGIILFAEKAEILDDLSCGSFGTAELYFQDGSFINSNTVQQNSSKVLTAKNVRYYLCPSADKLDVRSRKQIIQPTRHKNTLFSLRAKKAILDDEKEKISFYHTVLYLKKMPIFYLPYISMVKPGATKHSGFYGLSYVDSGKIGSGLELEYRFYDKHGRPVVIKPTVYFNGALRLDSTYDRDIINLRPEYDDSLHLRVLLATDNGQLTREQNLQKRDTLALRFYGQKFLNYNWSLDYNTFILSNKRYLYNFEGDDRSTLPFEINFRYISDTSRTYASFGAIAYRELYETSFHREMPVILPINLHMENQLWQYKRNNLYYTFDTYLSAVERKEGEIMHLSNIEPALTFVHRGNIGQITLKSVFQWQWLQYDYRQSRYNSVKQMPPAEEITRSLGKTSIDWRFPLLKRTSQSFFVFEPRIKLVSSNIFRKELPPEDVVTIRRRNESSRTKELQTYNVFSDDLFSGYDLTESGQRLSYGATFSWNHYQLGNLNLELAQMYILRDDSQLYETELLLDEHSSSSLLGKLTFNSVQDFFRLYLQFTLDKHDGSLLSEEISGNWRIFENLRMYIGYNAFKAELLHLDLPDKYVRNTINAGLQYDLNRLFTLNIKYTWDLEEDRLEYQGINLAYHHSCVEIAGNFYIDYVEKRELALGRHNTRGFNLEIRIKNSLF